MYSQPTILLFPGDHIIDNRPGFGIRNESGIAKAISPSGSATGGHMYKYDRKRSNWLFSWCDIGNKGLSEQYEVGLQEHEKPPFNKLSMAGK